ncbi:MAG: hypothetical protein SGI90_16570 [Candidatus Eisenbacteria bacterium]|nr:hypothetical protein [Candidatus Eisenbacteria bacterium]
MLTLSLTRQRISIASIHEGQIRVRDLSKQIGGTEFYIAHPKKGAVIRDRNRIVGHISYNARWWPIGIPHAEMGPNNLGDLMNVVHHSHPKEIAMSKSKSPKNPVATPVTDAAEPVTVTTASKKAEAKVAKAEKAPKARKTPVEDLVVFAFRLTPAERDAIHAAAGPAKASKFVRAIALAAANRDEALVATILKGVMATDA